MYIPLKCLMAILSVSNNHISMKKLNLPYFSEANSTVEDQGLGDFKQ